NNGGCVTCATISPFSVSFPSQITKGDVVVVGVDIADNGGGGGNAFQSVSDSLGSSYTQAVTSTDSDPHDNLRIFYATVSTNGLDTITLTMIHASAGGELNLDLYIYEISGVTTSGAGVAQNSGVGD